MGKQGIKRSLLLGLVFLTNAAFAVTEPEAVPGEYIVKLRSNTKRMSLQSLGHELNASVKEQIPGLPYVVVKRPTVELATSAVKQIKQNPMVELVEPNYIYRAIGTPNDPDFSKLWGLKNDGQADSAGQLGTKGVDINAGKAWDITTGSEKVLVAVIDTGINYNHPDLKDNVWTNQAEANGKPGVDDDNNGYVDDIHGYNFVGNNGDPMDDHGHGSHCSGTIGGRGNDGKGIVGVNWNVKIMAAKFLAADGSGSLDGAIKSIAYANKMGAKVLSNSWGGGGFSQALKDVIETTNKSGALFVAAAGNESNNNDTNPSYPASYDVANVVSVAAIDNKGKIASFSNYGKKAVHIGAPGVKIYSSTLGSSYDSWSGTSMATPHVSGVAALVIANEAKKKRGISNIDLRNRLISTAKPVAGLKGKVSSNGMVDAWAALTNTKPTPDANDPAVWKSVALNISTPHPYPKNYVATFPIKVPGAKEIAIYFQKLETESGYDVVTVLDGNGVVVDTISGVNSDSFTSIIQGDSATISIKTDDVIHKYGFDVTKVAYR